LVYATKEKNGKKVIRIKMEHTKVCFLFRKRLDVQRLILNVDFFLYVCYTLSTIKGKEVYRMSECPVDDWWCPYYDNGNCTFEDYREEEEEIDKYS
jgi:hypothetical protein